MDHIDRQILEFCLDEFQPLKPLTTSIPGGTLYRHVKKLIRLALLSKEGHLYRTTEAGHRRLASVASGRRWEALADCYPPLALVPTPVHRALIELIFAAVVARQCGPREDRHPFFVAFGATLHWKTSLGRFVCHALGVDPATHVVECGAETGKSLTFRRTSTGDMVSRRELLDALFVVLDEYPSADPAVRTAAGVFLRGRVVVPVENERLTVRPVALLTLNPTEKDALEARIGLSAPLIRRGILADLDAIPMPDLATTGEAAIEAARNARPLTLKAPAAELHAYHDRIVELVRAVLIQEAHDRVDVEVVVNLCTGMTAFLPKPADAITQVLYCLGMLWDTLQWTRPGWTDVVSRFTGDTVNASDRSGMAVEVSVPAQRLPTQDEREVPPRAIALHEVATPRKRIALPELELSQDVKARLIWYAVDTQKPLEDAISALLDFSLMCRNDQQVDLEKMVAIMNLAEQLQIARIDVVQLHGYLADRNRLAAANCTVEDVPEALRVIELLEALPVAWDWKRAKQAMEGMAALLKGGIKLAEITGFLEQRRRLAELGFDDRAAVAVAEALERAGIIGDDRGPALDALVDVAKGELDRARLDEQRQQLEAEVATLTAEKERLRARLEQLHGQIAGLKVAVGRLNTAKTRFEQQCDENAGLLALLAAFRNFLVGKVGEAEPFWRYLESLLAWRKRGGRVDDAVGQQWTSEIRKQVLGLLQEIVQAMAKP